MHTVTLDEAQKQLRQLMDEVMNGQEVVILCDNVPVVKLVSAIRPGYGSYRGQITMADDFDALLDDFVEYTS